MFRNYVTIALRNLSRQKAFSIINILGLAIGLATCILIVRYIQDELSVDKWHPKGDRIYRIMRETKAGGKSEYLPFVSGAIGPALEQELPEVEKAVRLWDWDTNVTIEDKKFNLESFTVDPKMFEMFDFPFVKGSVETAFPNPASVAITESTAKQLFGNEDPIGKSFQAISNHKGGTRTVTAVLKDPPQNSTIQFDYISTPFFSSKEAHRVWNEWIPTHGYRPVNVYFLLREGADIEALKSKLPAFMERHMGAEIARTNVYHKQEFHRIYLYSWQDFKMDWFANIDQVYQFGAIAILDQQFEDMYNRERRAQTLTLLSSSMAILLACMGLFGLSAFTVEQRVKEIGVRKVLGASITSVVILISKTFAAMVLIANLVAWPIAYIAMRNWLDNFAYRTDLAWWIFVLGGAVALVIALTTVGYHALRAALSNPIEALRHE